MKTLASHASAKRTVFLLFVSVALACMVSIGPAFADAIPELSGDAEKSPRSGVPVPVKVSLDQPSTRNMAMDTLRQYRQEAYDEGIVDLPEGMTADEYINGVKWNADLERIAVQRAIESGASKEYSLHEPHTRLDGSSYITATSNGVHSSSEGFASWFIGDDPVLLEDMGYLEWARSSGGGIGYGMSLWKSEKASYIKNRNEGTRLLAGHYENLIDPRYKSYGMACVTVQGCEHAICAVEPSRESFETNDESVGYAGVYDAEYYANDCEYFTVDLLLYCADGGVTEGGTSQIKLAASSSLRGNDLWSVDSEKASYTSLSPWFLTVAADGTVTGVAEGVAAVYVRIGDEADVVRIPVTTEQAAFRLYNPYSGEHFYTLEPAENAMLVETGWRPEGLGWVAPRKSGDPVFRLYNPYAGEHHYTPSTAERDLLVATGWVDEGTGWNSVSENGQVLYREYNPNEYSCNHNYTTDKTEHDKLIALGWVDEGTAWSGVALEEGAFNDKPWRYFYWIDPNWSGDLHLQSVDVAEGEGSGKYTAGEM